MMTMGINVNWHLYDTNTLAFHKADSGSGRMSFSIITEEGEVTFFLPSKAMADRIAQEFSELFEADDVEYVPVESEEKPSEQAMRESEKHGHWQDHVTLAGTTSGYEWVEDPPNTVDS